MNLSLVQISIRAQNRFNLPFLSDTVNSTPRVKISPAYSLFTGRTGNWNTFTEVLKQATWLWLTESAEEINTTSSLTNCSRFIISCNIWCDAPSVILPLIKSFISGYGSSAWTLISHTLEETFLCRYRHVDESLKQLILGFTFFWKHPHFVRGVWALLPQPSCLV